MGEARKTAGVLLGALLVCAAGGASGAAKRIEKHVPLGEGAQPTAMERYLRQADAAIAAADAADGADAAAAASTALALADDPLFGEMTAPSQRRLLSSAAMATWRRGDPEGARELLVRATRIDGNDPDDWYRLANLESALGDRARATRYLTSLVRRWPHLANNLHRSVLVDYIFRGEPGNRLRTPLLEALFAAGWDDRGNGVDEAWRELALDQIAAGRPQDAAATVARIGDPLIIVGVHSDKRFDALAPAVAALPSPRDAAEQRVEVLRQRVSAEPRRVDLASTYGTALLVAGRHDEAIAASDSVLAAIAAASDPTQLEAIEERIWVMNNRAIALRRVGRIDEAVAEIERASRLDEAGGSNVSQVLNLSTLYCHLERPHLAQQAIARLGGSTSGYGRMVLAAVEHCAALQRGDRSGARRAMDYLMSHASEGEAVLLAATLRDGRLDDAARILIAQLDTPDSRTEALRFVQEFRRGPQLPGNRALRENYRVLLAREDVRAALERVGRTGAHDVFDRSGIE